jgi:WD40 repeat protein
MNITRTLLIPIALLLPACSKAIASPAINPEPQLNTSQVTLTAVNPIANTPGPTLPSSPTRQPAIELLPALQVITPGNARQVRLLRTLNIPGYKPSSVSQCSISFSPDGNLLAGVCDYSPAPVWEVISGELKYSLLDQPSHEVAVAFSPKGDVLVVAGFSGEIRLFDAITGEALEALAALPSQVWELAFNPVGEQLAASTFSTGVFLTCFPHGELIWNHGERGRVCMLSVAFSPDGTRLAAGGVATGVMLLEVESGKVTAELPVPAPVGDLAYSPDGKWLATGSDDNKIRLWDTTDNSLAETLVGHTGFVNGVTFSPDGSLLISGSHDRKVGIWDFQTGQNLQFLEGHKDVVLRLAINPAGTLIASVSWDGTVKLWGVLAK